jgi:hypothetical protein
MLTTKEKYTIAYRFERKFPYYLRELFSEIDYKVSCNVHRSWFDYYWFKYDHGIVDKYHRWFIMAKNSNHDKQMILGSLRNYINHKEKSDVFIKTMY